MFTRFLEKLKFFNYFTEFYVQRTHKVFEIILSSMGEFEYIGGTSLKDQARCFQVTRTYTFHPLAKVGSVISDKRHGPVVECSNEYATNFPILDGHTTFVNYLQKNIRCVDMKSISQRTLKGHEADLNI